MQCPSCIFLRGKSNVKGWAIKIASLLLYYLSLPPACVIFLAVSEDLWILANLTDPIQLNDGQIYDKTLGSFSSNSNETFAQLFSFTNPTLRNSLNYTELLEDNSENEYTSRMWDSDVSLVVFLSGLSNPTTLRITVDQQDLYYLLYFFATFAMYVINSRALCHLVWCDQSMCVY